MHYERISADCHLDLCWLPPDLFTSRAAAALRDRMPYVTDGPKGPMWVTKKGGTFGLANGMGSAGRGACPARSTARTAWRRPASTRTAGAVSGASASRNCA